MFLPPKRSSGSESRYCPISSSSYPAVVPQNILQAVSLAFIGILPFAKTLSISEAVLFNFQTNCTTRAKKRNGKMHTGLVWTMRYSESMCSCMWWRENRRWKAKELANVLGFRRTGGHSSCTAWLPQRVFSRRNQPSILGHTTSRTVPYLRTASATNSWMRFNV